MLCARHSMSMAVIGTLALLMALAARAREPAAVWFAPDPDTPDFTDLFTKPQLWPRRASASTCSWWAQIKRSLEPT
jgi:hypothetical protein